MTTTVIIGGGVVGLNVALTLSERSSNEVFLLEAEAYLGHHTSGRNSEVLHAGIAYPPHSLKARLCVAGNRLSRELFDRLGVPYRKTGKWVIATTDAEAEALQRVAVNAKASGAVLLEEWTAAKVIAAIPELAQPVAAMFSPSTAMIDVASYIQALDRALSGRDQTQVVRPCRVVGVNAAKSQVVTDRGAIPYDWLINAAGLCADEVYHMTGGTRALQIVPYKGEYYRWARGTITAVIYPVPGSFVTTDGDATKVSSLGIHLHRNAAGDLILGPSQAKGAAAAKYDYTMTLPAEHFARAVVPFLREPPRPADLEMAYAGNRPKVFEAGKPLGDFQIFSEGNIVHLLGIESPGLTAAPAIARHVMEMMS